jgi:hypothetical protein
MTDAPETIYAWQSGLDFGYGGWSLTNDFEASSKTEYTRTDISQARIGQLEAALDGLLEIADPAWNPIAFSNARAALKAKP